MRLATFNIENLFTRYLFARGVDRHRAGSQGFTSEDLRFRVADPEAKRLTAELITSLNADVLALQEVESLEVLKRFRDRMLGGREAYPHAVVIDGNDPRRIDVGVLSKFPLVHLRSWQHLHDGTRQVFDRDCLEVDVQTPLGLLTLYVNHFKSMRADGEKRPREATSARRHQQATSVRELICERFEPDPGNACFAILGDLNDRPGDDEEGPCGLTPLLDWEAVVDISERLPLAERWTHFYRGSRRRHSQARYQQLDYILLSRSLAEQNPHLPQVERRGQPGRADQYKGPRLAGTGHHRPKASDHCPLVFDIRELP